MPYRILLVDDQEDLLQLLESALVSSGYDVVTAASGTCARRELNSQTFDLMICDVVIPDVTGYELLHESSRNLPVIMMSGNFHAVGGRRLFEKSAKGLGCVDTLCKPFTPTELVETVEAVLSGEHPNSSSAPLAQDDHLTS